MKLTPLDIRHKEFKRGMRGYADVEVDEFLDQIADEYERLFKENIDLQDRVESLDEKVAGYRRIEETLQKTLVNAQASAEEQKQNANKQAQLVLQDAELKARQLVNEAYCERQAIEQSMAKLRSAEEDFRFEFRRLLDGYLRRLQDTPEVAEAPRAPDFSRHTAGQGSRRDGGGDGAAGDRPEPRVVKPAAGPADADDAPEQGAEPVAKPQPPAETADEPDPEPVPRYAIPVSRRSCRSADGAACRRACTPRRFRGTPPAFGSAPRRTIRGDRCPPGAEGGPGEEDHRSAAAPSSTRANDLLADVDSGSTRTS